MHATRLACLLGSVAFLAACGSSGGAKPETAAAPAGTGPGGRPAMVTPENIAKGKELYEKGVCVRCHNVGGAGSQAGPPLNDKNWLHGDGSFNQIFATIVSGFQLSDVIGGYPRAMPPRGELQLRNQNPTRLTDDEARMIAAYVWSISHDAQ